MGKSVLMENLMMRRIVLLVSLALTMLACTLTDDFALGAIPAPADSLDGLISTLPTGRTEDGAFYLGSEDAPVTIVIFEDWYCPHCQNYKPTVDQLIETYVSSGQARYERRIFPTAGGDNTTVLGQWIECAAEEYGANYFIANNILYRILMEGAVLPTQAGWRMAEELGLSAEKLEVCAKTATQVDIDLLYAYELGVNGTPSVWIRYADGAILPVIDRTFEGLSALIDPQAPGEKLSLPFPVG